MNALAVAKLLQDAVAAHKAGRLDDAERLYRAVLAQDNRNFNALHFLGVIVGDAGNRKEGIDLYRKAAKVLPTSVLTHVNLGELLRLDGQLQQAATSFETALRLDPTRHSLYNSLGLVRIAQERLAEAASCFEQAVRVNPNSANAWHNLGQVRHLQERQTDAITAFRRALALEPKRLDTRTRLALALFEMEAYEESLEACRAALEVEPAHLPALRGMAITQARRDPSAAIETIDGAIRLAPNDGDLREVRGSFLQQAGRFKEAIEDFNIAMELPGHRMTAHYSLAHSKKFRPGDETFLSSLKKTLLRPGLSPDDQSSLHFAAGKVLDDLGRYEEAIGHYDKANRLWRTAWAKYRTADARAAGRKEFSIWMDKLVGTFDSAEIARLSQASSPSNRPIVIVGMMRSGTTLTEQILASHPDVAAGGELVFWSKATQALRIPSGTELGLDDARRLTQDYSAVENRISRTHARVTDKMPHNYVWLGLIHALFPNARLIHCRRHPIDVALSSYFTRFSGRLHEFSYDRADIVHYYKEYRRVMAHWRGLLPADRFIEIDYENLVADQETVSRRIVEFCGLEWNDACLAFHETDRQILTASAWQARQPIYKSSAERWRRYEPWLGEFRELLTLDDP